MPIKILTKLQMTQHCQSISTGFGNLLPWRNPSIGCGNVWRRWHSGDVHHTHNALICVVCKVQTRLSDSMQLMRSNEIRHIFSGITRIVCQKSCVLQCTSFTLTVKDRNLMWNATVWWISSLFCLDSLLSAAVLSLRSPRSRFLNKDRQREWVSGISLTATL